MAVTTVDMARLVAVARFVAVVTVVATVTAVAVGVVLAGFLLVGAALVVGVGRRGSEYESAAEYGGDDDASEHGKSPWHRSTLAYMGLIP
jgi:hypothetical protein